MAEETVNQGILEEKGHLAFDWKCPFCNHNATITTHSLRLGHTDFTLEEAQETRRIVTQFILCPNLQCKKFTLEAHLYELFWVNSKQWMSGELIKKWQLIPGSSSKTLPAYVPQNIVDDYDEASAIVTLSPKASATLARRCLQGILTDFFKLKPGNLVEQFSQVKPKLDPLSWETIKTVLTLGSIRLHMEKGINLITEVDDNEPELLISLIEMLINDCYIAREERKLQLDKIKKLGKSK